MPPGGWGRAPVPRVLGRRLGSVLCILGFEASGPKPARRDHGVKLKLKTSEPAPDLRSAATPSAQACCRAPDAWDLSHGPWWRRPGPGARGQVGGLGPDLSVGRVWSVIWSIGPRAREPRVRGWQPTNHHPLGRCGTFPGARRTGWRPKAVDSGICLLKFAEGRVFV